MSCSALQRDLYVCLHVLAQHVPAAGGGLACNAPIVYGLILVVSTAPRYPTCIDHKAYASDMLLFHRTKKDAGASFPSVLYCQPVRLSPCNRKQRLAQIIIP